MSKNIVIAIIVLIVLVALVLIFSGEPEPVVPEPEPEEETISGSGVISYIDLEGGFYGILADDGTQYYPINLDEGFEEDGLMVEFLGQLEEDFVSIHMWGTPITLMDIQAIPEVETEEEDDEENDEPTEE